MKPFGKLGGLPFLQRAFIHRNGKFPEKPCILRLKVNPVVVIAGLSAAVMDREMLFIEHHGTGRKLRRFPLLSSPHFSFLWGQDKKIAEKVSLLHFRK